MAWGLETPTWSLSRRGEEYGYKGRIQQLPKANPTTGRETHPIQQFRKRIHLPIRYISVLIRLIRKIRVTMLCFEPHSSLSPRGTTFRI